MALSFYLSVQGCLGLFSLFISAKFQEKWYEELNQMYIAQKIQRKKRQQKNIKKTTQNQTLLQITKFGSNTFAPLGKRKIDLIQNPEL